MATSKTSAKAVPKKMACVTIGFDNYLMPADKAIKVVELLQDAFCCEPVFEPRRSGYQVTEQPSVELKLLQPGQVHDAQGLMETVRSSAARLQR